MTEKQLNLKYLKERYKHPTWEAMLEISSEQYIRGLKQGKFDCEMDLINLQQIEKEHQKINGELREENKGLKGRIEYLERSCERKDESNIELYSENVDLASAIDEIKKYIDEYLLNERLVTYRDFRNGLLKIIEKVEK